MGRRLILDTNILIDYEHGDFDITQFDDDKLAIAGVTLAEYRYGIEMDSDLERVESRENTLREMLKQLEVLVYDENTATVHARLMAYEHKAGHRCSPHDLIIAAHAAQTGRMVATRDATARFGALPGVMYFDVRS
uniref:type II toxin-antitoxin system VapC family toxin n=1 Tax=Mobiluncus sp. TaxID=47293 RepID=UPI002589FD01|nr:PIN domain-containing protein [Mobiluncus sp.]